MMKHFKLLLTVALVAFIGAWTFATIEVQTTTPKVNPDGTSELVGQMRLIFSYQEFGSADPNDCDTRFYVLVRVQPTLNKRVVSVGGKSASAVRSAPINLVWERDTGAFPLETYTEAGTARIVDFYVGDSGTGGTTYGANSYIELLFMDDMKAHANCTDPIRRFGWPLTTTDRVRVTIGAPPFDTNNTEDPHQDSTQICVDFSPVPDEFQYRDLWPVGMDAHEGTNWNTSPPYPVNFQPASPDLAQKGSPTAQCRIYAWWPGKSDNCKPAEQLGYAQNEPMAQRCSNAGQVPPCTGGTATWWLDFCYDDSETDYNHGSTWNHHWFAIREDGCPSQRWLFYPGGRLTITLNSNELDPAFDFSGDTSYCNYEPDNINARAVVIWGSGSSWNRHEIDNDWFTQMTDDTWEITLPPWVYGTGVTHPTTPVCIALRMPAIAYNYCPMLTRLSNDCVPFTVNISFTNSGGCASAPSLSNWEVGKACGCEQAPTTYQIPLYFPFIPPVNMTGIAAYIAITNYADQPLDDGEIDFYTDQGWGFIWKPNWSMPTPLGGHQQWILNLGDAGFKANVQPRSTSQPDKTYGNRNMSAIAYMKATDTIYPFGYLGYENGSLAGPDGYLWIVLGDTAQGYLARHLDFEMNFYGYPGTQWVKPKGYNNRNDKSK